MPLNPKKYDFQEIKKKEFAKKKGYRGERNMQSKSVTSLTLNSLTWKIW
jgi:hypothetical protein